VALGAGRALLGVATLIAMSAQPDPASEWWTTSDVAAYLGLKVSTVSAYRARGQMPEPDMSLGRTHVWKPRRIISWHESRTRVGVGGRRPINQDASASTDE
jgi:predicted DNA-binding transcriptional regulator AlpA